jgi:hypothetical protein
MSTPRLAAGATGSGNDVSVMVASGPYTIAAGDSIVVGFAILAADSLTMLEDAATAADIKFNSLTTSVNENAEGNFSLKVFPNPSGGNTKLNFSLPKTEQVKVEIVDIAGSVVMTPVDEILLSGRHEVKINGKDLGGGIYFVKLITPENKEIKKFVVTK